MRGPKKTCILQEPTETRTATGGVSQSWADVTTFRAMVAPLKPFERVMFNRVIVDATHRLMMDYKAVSNTAIDKVKEKNRIKITTIYYDIKSVTNYHNRHLELDIKEIVT